MMSDTQRLEQMQTIIRYFPYWQGLKNVPVGIMLLAMAVIWQLQYRPSTTLAFWVLMLASITACLLACSFISQGYRRKFGAVSNRKVNRRVDGLTYLVAAPLLFVLVYLDTAFKVPISLTAVAYGGFFLWLRVATGGGRIYYIWLALALFMIALFPSLGITFQSGMQMVFVVLGVGTLAGGILDHLELIRIFKPIKDDHGTAA